MGQVVTLKMIIDEAAEEEARVAAEAEGRTLPYASLALDGINAHLPPQIRLFRITRVTGGAGRLSCVCVCVCLCVCVRARQCGRPVTLCESGMSQ